jgi:hypothetical protein
VALEHYWNIPSQNEKKEDRRYEAIERTKREEERVRRL